MIDFPGGNGPLAGLVQVLQGLATAVGMFILVLIWIALLVLLARFLWFGTRAMQRYLALHPAPGTATSEAAPDDPSPGSPPNTSPAAATPTGRKPAARKPSGSS